MDLTQPSVADLAETCAVHDFIGDPGPRPLGSRHRWCEAQTESPAVSLYIWSDGGGAGGRGDT